MIEPDRLYLDYAASAPLRPCARAAMERALDLAGNPSSVHAEGRAARSVIEEAREKIAALLGARPKQVVFTSGASEANVWAARGPWRARLVSAVEHVSVLEPARRRGAEILGVDGGGVVDLAALEEWLAAHVEQGAFVSIQTANNETGVRQPVEAAARLVKEAGGVFHTDAVQAAGKVSLNFTDLGADLMSVSAHKLGGPKGVGALVVREDAGLGPLLSGGGQELGRRAGTENLPAIAGFGAAAEAAMEDIQRAEQFDSWRDGLEAALKVRCPGLVVMGEGALRVPTISNFALPGASAESLVIRLDLAGAAVSAGAACSSGKVGPSHVAAAMGADEGLARAALRVSFGWASRRADLDRFADLFTALAAGRAERANHPSLLVKA